MKHKLIYFLSLFLLMLITGVFWGTWFTVTRSFESFSAEEFIHIGKVIIANVAVPMSIIMPLGILLMILSLWFYPKKRSAAFYAGVLSFVLLIVTLLVTLTVLVPIDNEIKNWTSANLPVDFEFIRKRWKTFHAIRTFTSLASFAFYSWFILARYDRKELTSPWNKT
jgi:hypothetical protein